MLTVGQRRFLVLLMTVGIVAVFWPPILGLIIGLIFLLWIATGIVRWASREMDHWR